MEIKGNRRARIALINNIPETWGAGKYAFMLYRELSKKLSVDHVYLNHENGSLEINGKAVAREKAKNKVIFLKKIGRFIPRYDIYHFTNQNLSFLIRKEDCAKSIVTCHDIYPYIYPKNIFEKVGRGFLYSGLKRTKVIIADSEYTKKELVKHMGIDQNKIKVVYLGVSERFVRESKKKSRERFGLSLSGKIILHIGEVEDKRKNTKRVFRTFLRLRRRVKNLTLLRIGKGNIDYSGVINMYKISEKDMVAAYNAADVLFFPSLYEGFGLPPLEAMKCGTPVITSDKTSIPEIVKNAAIIVNPYNEKEMESALYKVLTDKKLASKLSRKGLIRAEEFTWSKTASQIFKIYKELE